MTTPYASEAFLHQLLGKALAASASDVHLKVGQPPGARVRGDMVYFRVDKIRPEDTEAVARLLLGGRIGAAAGNEQSVSYGVPGVGRFRVAIYRQRGSLAVVMRSIPLKVPVLDEIGAPAAARGLTEGAGLVLLTGAAHSGKSTTAAAMIGHVNETQPRHVITIEDPIEFVHDDARSSVSQREVGVDTSGYAAGLAAALRQDPDLIHVAELRDAETLELALQAVEAGHLVLATVRAPDSAHALARVLALGATGAPAHEPAGAAAELRGRVGEALRGVIAHRLVPRRDGGGLALAAEVLIGTGAVREAIVRAEAGQSLRELMEKGAASHKMQTFEMHLRQLVAQNLVAREALGEAS